MFESGSRTGVAITVLVKDPTHSGTAEIFYAEAEDYATRQEKLNQINAFRSILGISGADAFHPITPNKHGDWISARDERFTTFQEIGSKTLKGKGAYFCDIPTILSRSRNTPRSLVLQFLARISGIKHAANDQKLQCRSRCRHYKCNKNK